MEKARSPLPSLPACFCSLSSVRAFPGHYLNAWDRLRMCQIKNPIVHWMIISAGLAQLVGSPYITGKIMLAEHDTCSHFR